MKRNKKREQARRMMSREEVSTRSSVYDTRAWDERKEARSKKNREKWLSGRKRGLMK